MVSWALQNLLNIFKKMVCVISLSLRLRLITENFWLDNSSYHWKIEFNNYQIFHISTWCRQNLFQLNPITRPSSRRLQQACCQPVVECRRQAACQMRSRGMLRPVVTWLLQTVVRSAANCCDRTAAALLETNLLHPVVTELRQCCCGQNCSRL